MLDSRSNPDINRQRVGRAVSGEGDMLLLTLPMRFEPIRWLD
jgi:hypothetical protein